MKTAILSVLGIVVVLNVIWYLNWDRGAELPDMEVDETATQTDETIGTTTVETHTTPDGALTFMRPDNFGLAVREEQVLVESTIPPCEEGFDYCLYYNGNEYEDTNFESAGVSIRERSALSAEGACLTTPPEGYLNLEEAATSSGETYAASLFAPLDDAGAGHYSYGEEYRVFVENTCYEIDARLGESQFANYPAGSIGEFTMEDREELEDSLRMIIDSMSIGSREETFMLPQV